MEDGLIRSGVTVFDYGCGFGDDVRYLRQVGIDSRGWDPVHRQHGPLAPAEIVNLGYVVNVIEQPEERSECVLRAWSYAGKALIVSARLASHSADLIAVREFADGIVTSRATFQKLYEQDELKAWLETLLGHPAVAAGPGVFYVFRSGSDRIGFLASRHRRRMKALWTSTHLTLAENRKLLEPLMEFFGERGRMPVEDELPSGDAIRERFGSLRSAFRLMKRGYEPEQWRRIISAREQDLLLFLALSHFDGRPRFGELPMELRRDIRGLFSTYRQACKKADAVLLASGDMKLVRRATHNSEVGKKTPSAIYVHESAIHAIPPLLRLYEGCARRYIGRVEGANVIKLHTEEPMISYLSYPAFESDPHPALAGSLTVHLQTFRLREHDYSRAGNPPILHRKELFLSPGHPLFGKFSRLTRQEEANGLFDDTLHIGTRRGWEQVLSEKGFQLKGHRLVHSRERSASGSSGGRGQEFRELETE